MTGIAFQVVNRIAVSDIVRGAQQQKMYKPSDQEVKDGQKLVGDLIYDDKGKPIMGPLIKDIPQKLYTLVGKARSHKTGTTQYGDYREYTGVFRATRITDGKEFRSSRCILPPPTDAFVENMYDHEKHIDPTAEVWFAFLIGTEEHRHGDEIKFRYTCEPFSLGDTKPDIDPLSDILSIVGPQIQSVLALPAPQGLQAAQEPDKSQEKPADQQTQKKVAKA